MANRSRREQLAHDSLLLSIVHYLSGQGHSGIKADLQGYPKPDLVAWPDTPEGHYPDITSTKGQNYLFEVETEGSINDAHTEGQWKLFSADAKAHAKLFIIVVPKGFEDTAQARARNLGVHVNDVWTVD